MWASAPTKGTKLLDPVEEVHAEEVDDSRAGIILHAVVLDEALHIDAIGRHAGELLRGEAAGLALDLGAGLAQIAAAGPHHDAAAQGLNLFSAKVLDIVYQGPQTNYWVEANGQRICVRQQHNRCFLDLRQPTWNDEVWMACHKDDVNMLSSPESSGES